METKTNRKPGFARIDKVLNKTAKQYHLENALYKHQAIKHWHEIAGAFLEEAKNLTQAVDLQKGVLTVACLSREIAAQLKLLSQRIIYALNQFLGRQLVYAIHVEM